MMIQKFRAFDKEHKMMCEVTLIRFSDVQYMSVKYRINKNGKKIDEWSNLDDDACGTCVLMQSTGLKDKNGVEIYEGDIVRVAESDVDCYISAVKNYAEEGYPAFDIECPNGWYYESNILSTIMAEDFETIEIIGNIYENPELLEVK